MGLGGNIGNVKENMSEALAILEGNEHIRLDDVSRLYVSPPWGDTDQPDFLNACCVIETNLTADELLDVVKSIEQQLHRRETRRWGPRTIDIDILVFGDHKIRTGDLEIPHPRMTDRAFVMVPLAELAPDLMVGEKTVREWAQRTDREGLTLAKPAGVNKESWFKSG